METESKGLIFTIDPSQQTDEWLMKAGREIIDETQKRQLELSKVIGVIATSNDILPGVSNQEIDETINEYRARARKSGKGFFIELGVLATGLYFAIKNGSIDNNSFNYFCRIFDVAVGVVGVPLFGIDYVIAKSEIKSLKNIRLGKKSPSPKK